METPRRRLPVVPALLLITVLTLLMVHTTRWLVTSQLEMLFTPPRSLLAIRNELGVKDIPAQDVARLAEAQREVAARFPNEYPIQLAAALKTQGGSTATVQNLRLLASRFPDRPSLYAHILRYATAEEVHIRRDSEVEPYMTGKPYTFQSQQASTPEALAAFDRDASAGEKLDPNNACFPLMRAIGLFAAHRDAEGLAAVQRASRKPRWDDYTGEETEANRLLLERTYGKQSSTLKSMFAAALLFPSYASLRGVARMTAYKATQAEVAGHTEEGLAIRRAMMRCGSMMRVQSGPAIGSLVGIAMVATEINRPGGTPPLPQNTNQTADQRYQQRLDGYLSYLNRIGHADEAHWVRSESAAGREAKAIVSEGNYIAFMVSKLNGLIGWWMADMMILTNAVAMLALCVAAALLARTRRTEGTFPAALLIGIFLVFVVFAWHAQWAEAFGKFRMAYASLTADTSSGASSSPTSAIVQLLSSSPAAIKGAAMLLSPLVPLLTLITLGILSQTRRQSFSPVAVRSLLGGGLVVTCLLWLLYGGMVLTTAQKETQFNTVMDHWLNGEGRYDAQLIGKTWPGPPR
jgi:hypothetical protein